jgi:hypothetical protein
VFVQLSVFVSTIRIKLLTVLTLTAVHTMKLYGATTSTEHTNMRMIHTYSLITMGQWKKMLITTLYLVVVLEMRPDN